MSNIALGQCHCSAIPETFIPVKTLAAWCFKGEFQRGFAYFPNYFEKVKSMLGLYAIRKHTLFIFQFLSCAAISLMLK